MRTCRREGPWRRLGGGGGGGDGSAGWWWGWWWWWRAWGWVVDRPARAGSSRCAEDSVECAYPAHALAAIADGQRHDVDEVRLHTLELDGARCDGNVTARDGVHCEKPALRGGWLVHGDDGSRRRRRRSVVYFASSRSSGGRSPRRSSSSSSGKRRRRVAAVSAQPAVVGPLH